MSEDLKIYHTSVTVKPKTEYLDVQSNNKDEAIQQAVERFADSLEFDGTIYAPDALRVEREGSTTHITDLQNSEMISFFRAVKPQHFRGLKIIQSAETIGFIGTGLIVGFALGILFMVVQVR
jgi:hypothetical protein